LTKQFRPAIVSPFSVAETPLSATLHHFFHDAETPLFSTFDCSSLTMLKHYCSTRLTLFFFHDAETPLFSMFDFFLMLKHYRSTLFDFLPILKHQSSAVLHLQQLFRSSLLLKHQSLTTVRQQAFTPSDYSSTF
jgi:hypothetical protein